MRFSKNPWEFITIAYRHSATLQYLSVSIDVTTYNILINKVILSQNS